MQEPSSDHGAQRVGCGVQDAALYLHMHTFFKIKLFNRTKMNKYQ